MTGSLGMSVRVRAVVLLVTVLFGQQGVHAQFFGREDASARAPQPRATVPDTRTRATGSASGDRRLDRFDPSTRLLIETELRHATAEERERWMELLATVENDQVPYLLQVRRRARHTATEERDMSSRVRVVDYRTESSEAGDRSGAAPGASRESEPETGPMRQVVRPADPGSSRPERRGSERSSDENDSSAPGTLRRAIMSPLRSWRSDAGGDREDQERTADLSSPSTSEPEQAEAGRSEFHQDVSEIRRPDPSSALVSAEAQRLIKIVKLEADDATLDPAADPDALVRRHLRLRLLHLIAEEPEQALAAIPGLPADEQEFWTHLLWCLANELDRDPAQSRRSRKARSTELLEEALYHLNQQAELVIGPACFCHRINSFGDYETFARDEFQPGQPVLLYAQLRNFRSELTGNGWYVTRLRTAMQIVQLDGASGETVVDRRDFQVTEDRCRTRRSDYFHSYRIDLPSHLVPGRHRLRLQIVDEYGHKDGVVDLPFVIR